MKISARLKHAGSSHEVDVQTADRVQRLALATCCCNDLCREAARLGLALDAVAIAAEGDFDGVGLAATNVRYRARVTSDATADQIERLLRETDAVAEVHNTLRRGVPVLRVD